MIRLLAFGFSALAVGCHCKPTTPDNSGCIDRLDTCHGILCGGGGNSPYTNIFPANGLSPIGKCNDDQIRLVPSSLSGPQCPAGTNLETDESHTHLVGRKNGKLACAGAQLKDATFEIGTLKHSVKLKIADVRPYQTSYEGYRIEYNGETTCNYDTSVKVLADLGFKPPEKPSTSTPTPDGYKPDPDDDLVIAKGGGVFDVNTGNVVYHGDNYFNLACVGDALAKATFYNLASTEQGTVAALRMLTARYGTKRSYTVRGMMIDWTVFQQSKREPKLEALWDADGKVLCIETPRLVNLLVNGKPFDTKELPKELQPVGCVATGSATTPGICDRDEWIAKLKAESDVKAPCSSVQMDRVALESCSDVDGKLVLSSKNVCPAPVTAASAPPASAPTNPDPAAPK